MDNKELPTIENLCGGGGCSTPAPTPAPNPTANTTANVPLELHICMGLNACKGHDRYGTNDCAGMGYCATAAAHTCHTLNNCRGQGGCGLYGDGEEQNFPGANDCAWQGSCAVPVQAERYSTQGPNKGKSVWVLARRLFEERMRKANRNFGDSPYKCGPPQAWLTQILGSYDSCGNSGDKYCTFGFNNPAVDAKELCQNSQPHLCGTAAPNADAEANHCNSFPTNEANHCSSSSASDVNKCGADVNKSGSDVNKCGADVNKGDADVNKCSVDVNACGADVSKPGADVNKCGADVNKCSVDVSNSDVDVNKCGADVNACGADKKSSDE